MGVDKHETNNNRKLIAIVEDDANLAIMFQDMLKEQGRWRLQIFSDGREAMDRLPDLAAHLILLDFGLANLDCISLYIMLRGHSISKNSRFIVITGSQDWELHRQGLQTGILLRKPFSMEQLLFMIRALLPDDEETN